MVTHTDMPQWVQTVMEIPIQGICHLPTSPKGTAPARRVLRVHNKSAYIKQLGRVNYGADGSRLEKLRKQLIGSLSMENAQTIWELEVSSQEGMVRLLFTEGGQSLIQAVSLPVTFVNKPRWTEVISVWPWIIAMGVCLAFLATITAPTLYSAAILFAVALSFYLLSIWLFGPSHAGIAAIPTLVLALIIGLLWGAFYRTNARKHSGGNGFPELRMSLTTKPAEGARLGPT